MTHKHFVNLSLGILGEPDPLWMYKQNIADLSQPLLDDLLSGNVVIVMPTVGQGSEIQALLEMSSNPHAVKSKMIAVDKFKCFTNRVKRIYNITSIWHDFLTWTPIMKNDKTLGDNEMTNLTDAVWLMNPPYNDGTTANNPIYQHFIDKVTHFKPKAAIIIVQANWLMRDNKMANKIRDDLRKIGVKKITLNPVDAFPNAQVKTVSILCERDYTGDVEFVNAVTGESIQLKTLKGLIPFCFDNDKLNLLHKLIPTNPRKYKSGDKGPWDKFLVATAYQNFDISNDPFGYIRLIEPNCGEDYNPKKRITGYRILGEFDTKEEAEKHLEYNRSFWHSKPVTFVMKYRRTSYTLDNSQISWVPNVVINKIFTNEDLYKLFNLNKNEIKLVESEFEQ